MRDPNVLAGMKAIYAPVFDVGMDFTLAEQMSIIQELLRIGSEPKPGEEPRISARRLELKHRQTVLARRETASAKRVSEYAARADEMNRNIERQLHDLAVRLIASGVAVSVRD